MDLAQVREQLVTRRAEVAGRLARVESRLRHADGNFPDDWSERASETQNDQALEGVEASERSELAQLDAALARFEEGTYGVCMGCEEKIPAGRLAILPAATHCAKCAA